MERTITPEERQRRAEEVYNRRRNNSLSKINYTNENIVKEKVNISLFKKMILQILICMETIVKLCKSDFLPIDNLKNLIFYY